MKKKTMGRMARIAATVKAPKLTHLVRHPIKGPKNLLALRGAKSLLKTRWAGITAAVAAAMAVAVPLVMKVRRNKTEA